MIYEIEHTVMIEYVEQNGNRLMLQIFLKQGYDAPHWYDKLQGRYLKACCFGLNGGCREDMRKHN